MGHEMEFCFIRCSNGTIFGVLGTEKTAFALGSGVVLYDTVQAYKQNYDFVRVFLSGSVGFGISAYLSSVGSLSSWGITAINLLGGNGSLFLVSCPIIGNFVLLVIGLLTRLETP